MRWMEGVRTSDPGNERKEVAEWEDALQRDRMDESESSDRMLTQAGIQSQAGGE